MHITKYLKYESFCWIKPCVTSTRFCRLFLIQNAIQVTNTYDSAVQGGLRESTKCKRVEERTPQQQQNIQNNSKETGRKII